MFTRLKWLMLALFGIRRLPLRRLTEDEKAERNERSRHPQLYRRMEK